MLGDLCGRATLEAMANDIPATMKRLVAMAPGTDVASCKIEVEEVAVPAPQSGELLVRVVAAPINPSDYGEWYKSNAAKYPLPMGKEGCGIVVQSGGGLATYRFSLGAKVGFIGLKSGQGSYSEYVAIAASGCFHMPPFRTAELREERVEASYALRKQMIERAEMKDPDAKEEICIVSYVFHTHWSWSGTVDSKEGWDADPVGARLMHMTWVSPDQLQSLPGQAPGAVPDAIGPNSILSDETIALIPHLTDGTENNNDNSSWCGGLGFFRLFGFFFPHYDHIYVLKEGDSYYLYIVFGRSRTFGYAHQFRLGNGEFGHVETNPVQTCHAGLCFFPCGEEQRKKGPFYKYDMSLKFTIGEDRLPGSCSFTLLQLRRSDIDVLHTFANGGIELVEGVKVPGIKATLGEVVFTDNRFWEG